MNRERLQQKLSENHELLRQLRERRDGIEDQIMQLMWENDGYVEQLNAMRQTPVLAVLQGGSYG